MLKFLPDYVSRVCQKLTEFIIHNLLPGGYNSKSKDLNRCSAIIILKNTFVLPAYALYNQHMTTK